MPRAPKEKEYVCEDSTRKSVWYITKNDVPQNPAELTVEYWTNYFKATEIRWMVFQFEKGSKKHHYHVHCVVSFWVAKRFGTMKKHFGNPHLEWLDSRERKERFQYVMNYVQKERTRVSGPYTMGIVPKVQGERADLIQIRDAARSGQNILQIVENDEIAASAIRYLGNTEKLIAKYEGKRRKEAGRIEVTAICHWGLAGRGKSHDAEIQMNKLGGFYIPQIQNDKMWFEDYDGEPCLYLDDFKCNIPFGLFLNMLDGKPMSLDKKNSRVQNWWTHVYITSQTDPEYWYPNINEEERRALISRFSKIVEYDGPVNYRDLQVQNRRYKNSGNGEYQVD